MEGGLEGNQVGKVGGESSWESVYIDSVESRRAVKLL